MRINIAKKKLDIAKYEAAEAWAAWKKEPGDKTATALQVAIRSHEALRQKIEEAVKSSQTTISLDDEPSG